MRLAIWPPFPYETVHGGSVPATGPIGLNETLGFWFELDAPGELAGFARHSEGTGPEFVMWQLWDATPVLVAQAIPTAAANNIDLGAAGWRSTWLHPRARLAASTPYLLACYATHWRVDFGVLASAPLVNGHITVYQNGTSPNPYNGVYDAATDSSQRWDLANPPHDGTAGHLYGIDVLMDFG